MRKMMLIVLIASCLMASACDINQIFPGKKEEKDPFAACIIIADRECVPQMDVQNTPEIKETIEAVVDSEGYLSIVNLDGSPSEVFGQHINLPDEIKNANATMRQSEQKRMADNILRELSNVQAEVPEADTLAALKLAVRSLKSSGIAERRLMIIDSGLSTSGVIDFRNNLISADPETLAEMLMQRKEIPDFSEIRVDWFLIGDVSFPQEELEGRHKEQIREIWKAIIEKGGGTVVFKDNTPRPSEPRENLPQVSPIDLPDSEPIFFEKCDLKKEENPFREPVFLSESQVKFNGNSSDYSDPSTAISVISEIADYMNSNPSFRILLCGTTAGDNRSDFSRKLSLERAEAVKRTLIELGINENRILTRGLGSEDPWHYYGAGTSDDPLASANRKVVLMDADTDLARELLS